MKIDISEIENALKTAKIEPEKQKEILTHLQEVINELQIEKENSKEPKIKKDWGIILLDELGEIKTDNLSGLVYQINEGEDSNTVIDRVKATIKDFNSTEKGAKNPIKSISQAFCYIPPKMLKANGIFRKTKEIVVAIKSNNKL